MINRCNYFRYVSNYKVPFFLFYIVVGVSQFLLFCVVTVNRCRLSKCAALIIPPSIYDYFLPFADPMFGHLMEKSKESLISLYFEMSFCKCQKVITFSPKKCAFTTTFKELNFLSTLLTMSWHLSHGNNKRVVQARGIRKEEADRTSCFRPLC